MDIQALLDRLADSDDEQVRAAGTALVELGGAAVGPVLAVLCDESSPVEWSTSAGVLRRIGAPALGPLTEAIASAPTREVARRAGWAFSGLEIDDPAAFLPALHHSHPSVREDAAYVLQCRGEVALPHAPDLVALLLDDPEAGVRQRAGWALDALGPGVLPLLREARATRRGLPRRRALEALAAIGGPAALSERDLAVIRRLIRFKIPNESPEPMHVCGSWFAVPTGDRQALLEAFGLSDPEPVTMRAGASAWNKDHHAWAGPHSARVYISPRWDGWSLVFGDPSEAVFEAAAGGGSVPDEEEAARAAMMAGVTALSLRFGAAHWYGMSCGDEWTAWCVAENGQIVRYYDAFEPDEQLGPPHPAEAGKVLPHEDEGTDDEPELCDACAVAAQASVDPSSLGPHTRVEGHGLLALTAYGREHGHPPGALEI